MSSWVRCTEMIRTGDVMGLYGKEVVRVARNE
jgi:hypothetical protein